MITADTIRLARAFGSAMQEQLSRRNFNAVLDRNKAEEIGSGVCHSHDFCDANMVMLAAFEETFGRNPLDQTLPFMAGRADGMNDADTELWNDAWTIAREAEFYA